MRQPYVILLISLVFLIGLSACSTSPPVAPSPSTQTDSLTEPPSTTNQAVGSAQSPNSSATAANYISLQQAEDIALAHAGMDANTEHFTMLESDFDMDDGIPSYELEWLSQGNKFEYDIHAENGQILKAEKNDVAIDLLTDTDYITSAQAIEIALNDAGVQAADAKGQKAGLDRERSISTYDVEFRVGVREYEYTIHAKTGEILDFETDFS